MKPNQTYYLVRSVRLRREYREYARMRGLPVNTMKQIAGAKRSTEQRFDLFKDAKAHALVEDLGGADVEVYEVPVRAHRRMLPNWRREP